MVIKDLLKAYKDEELREAILILAKLLKRDKSYIYTYIDQDLEADLVGEFLGLMEERRQGAPLHYLLGERDFMGLDLYVARGVLIPRSDTELLVEYLIAYIGDQDLKIFEIGVGSGAISLALGHYLKQVQILGVDISNQALALARKNQLRLGLTNVSFKEGDLFQGIDGSFDIIVSNPPYISSGVIDQLEDQVKNHEPRLALDGGETGLDFYEKITRASGNYLRDHGLLIFEIGYDQAESVSRLLSQAGFVDIKVLKDLASHDRVVMGTKGRDL